MVVKDRIGRRRYVLIRAPWSRDRRQSLLEGLDLTLRPIHHGEWIIIRVRHLDLETTVTRLHLHGAEVSRVSGTIRTLKRWLNRRGQPMPPRKRRK